MTRAKQPRGLDTERRVLDAALAGFVAGGAQPASVHALAARSGASVGSIYHHFGSLDGVHLALYRRCLAAMLAAIAAAVLHRASTRAGVRALVRGYLRFAAGHPDESRFIYSVAHTGLVGTHRAALRALAAELVAPLAQWLAPRVAAGEIRALPPALLEVALIGPPAEAARRILDGAEDLTFDAAIAVLPTLVWRAVKGPAPATRGVRKSERRT